MARLRKPARETLHQSILSHRIINLTWLLKISDQLFHKTRNQLAVIAVGMAMLI